MLNTMRKGEWLEITIPENWKNITIDNLFRREWDAPKKLTHLFRMNEKVTINGTKADWNEPLAAGEKLRIKLFEEEESNISPRYMDISVLYEDDHLMVLNKPPYMNTHPNDLMQDTDTLLNAAVFYLQAKGEFRNIRHVHRLDRDTSGAILFAKHALAGAILDKMLERREIKRTYIAMVHGIMNTKKGTINMPIGRDRHHAVRRRVTKAGREAVTHYQVLKVDKSHQFTYVKCRLDTGRTHQIRVHFSYIGHPLAGDILYGGKKVTPRQALHAAKLEFTHPFTMEKVECYAPFIDNPPIFKGIDIHMV